MSYEAVVLADSVSPDGVRLTTMKVTYPRFIHSELMTHRMFSRNAASSRAIPTEKNIERVLNDPFIPETFNKRVKGMGVGEELPENQAMLARSLWEEGARKAVQCARALNELNVDKSRVNRLLEPFLWMTTIVSATEWDNFFGLRDHPAAQPEFQITARLMREAMENSQPYHLEYGWWHMPMLLDEELTHLCALREADDEDAGVILDAEIGRYKLVSAGRLARVSFDTHENFESVEKSIERAQMLRQNGHFSPFEHVARPSDPSRGEHTGFFANFRGWVQMRAEIPNESRFDMLLATA